MSSDDPERFPLTYEGGFEAVVARMDARREPLSFAKDEALPSQFVDLAPLKEKIVQALDPEDIPRAKDQSGNTRKSIELHPEFVGLPEICKLHGLLIAHLRKDSQPRHTMALFTRLWAEESEILLTHLDPRWLVSAITTFGDHGTTEVQRRVGQSMTVLFNTMKLYESERLYSGFAPEQEFKLKRLVRRKLPLNMDRFALVSGGLDVNMLGRLWVDAEGDAVIKPLAHALLNLLNADPGTVFRRFKTLRGRKIRQRSQKDQNESDETSGTQTWGVVSTIKAEPAQIAAFIDHHLALGADQITIYLDAPLPDEDLATLQRPTATLINCDDAYWHSTGKPRPEKHQQRQAFNATRAYREAQVDWLAHIDCDEFLHGAVTGALARLPAQIEALIVPPAEEIAQDDSTSTLLFRRSYFDAGVDKSVISDLYPTFGDYLRSGFISHTGGKTIARTGLPDVRFGVHHLKRDGKEISAVQRSRDLTLLHRHAPDWNSFKRHLAFRLEHGSYRDRGQARLGLGDILDVLEEEHGADGAKLIFDEVCAARPEVIDTLEAHGMLIRTKLLTNAQEAADA